MKIELDQARIAARLAALQAAVPADPLRPWTDEAYICFWPKGNGKRSAAPPPPWEPIGHGAWIAPYGTPMPQPHWADVFDQVEDFYGEDETGRAARYLLNNTVDEIVYDIPAVEPAAEGSSLEYMKSLMRLRRDKDLPPARRLEVGDAALAAITAGVPCASTDPAGYRVGTINDLTGIPIMRREDLPANAWRLVDARTGAVVDSGTYGASAQELERVIRQYIEDLAEEAEIPRHLLFE